ncbi:MAG: hypothetical protein ACOC0D_10240 [Spirochaeta sp.]
MRIQINQQPLDFTLEGSETVGDVLRELTRWIEDNGEIVVETCIDATDVSGGVPRELAALPAAEIGDIHIVSSSPLQYRLRRLTIMDNYMSLLEEAVLKGSLQTIQEITGEYPYIRSQLSDELNNGQESGSSELDTIIQAIQMETQELQPEQRRSVAVIIQMARTILQDRIREIMHPMPSLHGTVEQMQALLPGIVEVSIQLQTNNEKAAMQTVFQTSELLSKLLRILGIIQERGDITHSLPLDKIQESHHNLISLLQELESALAENDSVTVGDILEYEIAPVLEDVCSEIRANIPAAALTGDGA